MWSMRSESLVIVSAVEKERKKDTDLGVETRDSEM